MTDKQLLKITVLDLARLAELLGLNLQLALFPPPPRKEDIEAEQAARESTPPHVKAAREEIATWPDWKVSACGMDKEGNHDPTKTKADWGIGEPYLSPEAAQCVE